MPQQTAGALPPNTAYGFCCREKREREEPRGRVMEAKGPLREKCPTDNRKTSGKNGNRRGKKCLYLDHTLLQARSFCCQFHGEWPGQWGPPQPALGLDTQPWLIYQASREENPPAQNEACVACSASLILPCPWTCLHFNSF